MVAKHRLLMSKERTASYMSHLDLMRTMRRAFTRAGIALRYSEGFNPHAIMSFALPLSVCHESVCEQLDFETVAGVPDNALKLINAALPDGLFVSELYAPEQKFGLIRWLEVECRLLYKDGKPDNTVEALRELFSRESVQILKQKKGNKQSKYVFDHIDIIPQIKSIDVVPDGADILLRAVVSAQNPTLNPSALPSAIYVHIPDFAPMAAKYKRLEVYNDKMEVFR